MGQVLLVGQTVTSQPPSLQIHTHTREKDFAEQYELCDSHHQHIYTLKGLPIQLHGQTWDLKASKLHKQAAFKLLSVQKLIKHTALHLYLVYRRPESDAIRYHLIL